MSSFKYRILVVDDDPGILQTSSTILETENYEVLTAADGFEALIVLKGAPPNIIISDLRMPNMSGFELLSIVRRRFPHIPVIAISGEFKADANTGLIADWFFAKGDYTPSELFRKIANLIEKSPMRPTAPRVDRAPIWIPKSTDGYFVVTCTNCLRSFSVPETEAAPELRETECPFCSTTVFFFADPQTVRMAKA